MAGRKLPKEGVIAAVVTVILGIIVGLVAAASVSHPSSGERVFLFIAGAAGVAGVAGLLGMLIGGIGLWRQNRGRK